MTWVKLDDAIGENPKIAQLSDSAFALYITGLAYCNRNLTDGFIPHAVGIGQLRYCDGNAIPPIRELESGDLWEVIQGGWMIHDYPVYQPPREQVLAEREAARVRMEKVRSSRKVRANTKGSSSSPVPVPVPEPVPLNAESKNLPTAPVKNGKVGSHIPDRWPFFLEKLTEEDDAWGAVTIGACVKLAQETSLDAVTTALSFAAVKPPEIETTAYGWLKKTAHGLGDAAVTA